MLTEQAKLRQGKGREDQESANDLHECENSHSVFTPGVVFANPGTAHLARSNPPSGHCAEYTLPSWRYTAAWVERA